MAFIGATKYEGTAAVTSFTVPWACTAAGQMCVLAVAVGVNSGTAITTPAGWTPTTAGTVTFGTLSFAVFWRASTGAESGTVSVTITSATAAAVMVAYDTIDTTAIPSSISNNNSGTAITSPSLTGFVSAYVQQPLTVLFSLQSTTSAQTLGDNIGVKQRALALSSTTTPYISVAVWEDPLAQPGSSAGTLCPAGVTATLGAERVALYQKPPTAFAEAPGTAAVPSWANETAAAPLTPRSSLTGLSAIPTTGQLWPRGSTGTRG